MKLYTLAAAVAAFGVMSGAAFAAADDGWIMLCHDLQAWQEPLGAWYQAGDARVDPKDDRRLTGAPGHGVLVNGKDGRTKNLVTRQQWGDVEVQLEFMIPRRSNSGVKLEGVYEIQIADTAKVAKPTGDDCGGIYPRAEAKPKYHHIDDGIAPLTNAAKAAGKWQTLEIVFRSPRFDAQDKKVANAQFEKVLLNGKLIHDHVDVPYPTGNVWRDKEKPRGPLLLQADHGPVAFRNVRVRPLAEQPAFPVKVSGNKRYFVDGNGTPLFWLGTTQWQLFREYKAEDAATILQKSRSHGFAFVQVMLLGVGDGTAANVYGEKPWINDDPLTPNEAYFKHVDAVVQLARDNNLTISMTLFHQRYRKHITLQNARQWAQWLAERYKDAPNIVWSMTPEAKQEFVPILRELAAGLHAADGGRHLLTFKPDPAPYSSSFLHSEPWLDFNSMQTWKGVKLIYPMVTKDYNLTPVKPVLMAEGAYEAGSEYGFAVTPLWVRRQAYYSYLAGGHHTYGHNDSWRVLPTWKKALDAPGAVQMGILKSIFLARKEWWLLLPDQAVFASGGRSDGDLLHLAARHQDGKWAMLYLADRASFSVNMGAISAAGVRAFWVNPQSGEATSAEVGSNSGVKEFSTPDGWEDALLILEAAEAPVADARTP